MPISFDISTNGALTFKKSPDYEMKADRRQHGQHVRRSPSRPPTPTADMGTKPVDCHEVTNVDEPGVVTLSARQPMAGVLLTVTITDPDSVTTDQYDRFDRPPASIGSGRRVAPTFPMPIRGNLHPGGLGQRQLSTGDGYIQGPGE